MLPLLCKTNLILRWLKLDWLLHHHQHRLSRKTREKKKNKQKKAPDFLRKATFFPFGITESVHKTEGVNMKSEHLTLMRWNPSAGSRGYASPRDEPAPREGSRDRRVHPRLGKAAGKTRAPSMEKNLQKLQQLHGSINSWAYVDLRFDTDANGASWNCFFFFFWLYLPKHSSASTIKGNNNNEK